GLLLAALTLALSASHVCAQGLYEKTPFKADRIALPGPADIQALSVFPTRVQLKGQDDSLQLVVSGALSGGRQQDLTGDVKYEGGDGKIVKVTPAGRIIPLTNGSTQVTAAYGDKKIAVDVKTESCDVHLAINFPNQIVPIFTKLGCNSGGC